MMVNAEAGRAPERDPQPPPTSAVPVRPDGASSGRAAMAEALAPACDADVVDGPSAALAVTDEGPDVSVWRNGPFLRLWLAQAITQTAHNALWYALMVLVEQISHSTTHLGVTILTVVIPSVLFGVPAGVLVDHLDKRWVLIVCNGLRAALMLGFVAIYAAQVHAALSVEWLLLALFGLSFVFSTVTQFFAPAETALIPALVHRTRLLQANSLFHITFIASQLAGLVLIGPLVVKLFGMTAFFIAVGMGLALSAVLVWPLPAPRETSPLSAVEEGRRVWRRLRHDVGELLYLLRHDAPIAWAMLHLTVGNTLALVVAMLAPKFVVTMVGLPAEDVVYVMAPAGVGMLIAAVALQHVGERLPKEKLVHLGLGALGAGLAIVGLLPGLWRLLPITRAPDAVEEPHQIATLTLPFISGSISVVVNTHEPQVTSLVAAIMAVTLVAGLGFAAIIVPAQTILQEQAPADSRGRIFAVQLMLSSVATVVPLLFIGGLADLIGTAWVFVGVGGGLLLLLAILEHHARRKRPLASAPAVGAVEA
jgi:MFS family permease